LHGPRSSRARSVTLIHEQTVLWGKGLLLDRHILPEISASAISAYVYRAVYLIYEYHINGMESKMMKLVSLLGNQKCCSHSSVATFTAVQ